MKHIKTFFAKFSSTILVSIVTTVTTLIVVVLAGGAYLFTLPQTSTFIAAQPNVNALQNQNSLDLPPDVISPQKDRGVAAIVAAASPAVVSIVATKDVPVYEQYYENYNPFGDDFFMDFFGRTPNYRIPKQRQKGTEEQKVGTGTGFFVSADGLLVTNRHVIVDDSAKYTITTESGKTYNAKIVAKDNTFDVAVLKVEGRDFPHLKFGDSSQLRPGQSVIAIGNALGEFQNSVSVGVISGLSRSIVAGNSMFGSAEQLDNVIQTDAAINPGNSGGPLINADGLVIGVNVAVSQGAENIGFALPANMVKQIVESVQKNGEIVRPYLGVRYVAITPELKQANNLKADYGVLILRGQNLNDLAVMPGSPAHKAGLTENDIILEFDGVKLNAQNSLATLIRQKNVGQKVKLLVLSSDKQKTIEVTLEKAPTN